jgi:hypothetical protein
MMITSCRLKFEIQLLNRKPRHVCDFAINAAAKLRLKFRISIDRKQVKVFMLPAVC